MPPGAAEATVVRWRRREGDFVDTGEPLVEVSGPGGNQWLAAPAPGTLNSVLRRAGARAPAGAVLGLLAPLPETGTHLVPLTPARQTIARHMICSVNTSAHITVVAEVDVSRLVALRQHYREAFERRHGVPLTYLPFFLQATVAGLRRRPVLNAELTPGGILLKRYIHLGFVVAVPGHVITPVLRNAERMGLTELALAVKALTQRARAGQVTAAEVSDCTFTVTNPGAQGGHILGTPIIQQPNVGILSFETITRRPVAVGDQVAVRPMMYLCLAFDHRVADGVDADAFLDEVRANLINPPLRW